MVAGKHGVGGGGLLPPRRYRPHLLAGVAVLALLALSAVWGDMGVRRWRRLEERRAALAEQAFELQQENLRLRRHLERLARDDAYLERVVRERLGWIRPGELVYRTGEDDGADGGVRTRPRIGTNSTSATAVR